MSSTNMETAQWSRNRRVYKRREYYTVCSNEMGGFLRARMGIKRYRGRTEGQYGMEEYDRGTEAEQIGQGVYGDRKRRLDG